ncbi:MAG: DUF4831 family protein [Prevotella sp.]|jgi:hypothetical protein|nr:DUF4831 family protein [Prevotella sp.]MCI1282664.1 DUF4831 family protein [Prevotella sp.]
MIKKIFFTLAFLNLMLSAQAQEPVMGTTYYLPKTALRFSVLIEKTEYTPGQFAAYAERYMKKNNVGLEPSVTYRITSINMTPVAVPDTSKQFTLQLDKKYSIREVDRDASGILLAINTKGNKIEEIPTFKAAKRIVLPNPNAYMNEDILSAGSTAKMAELCAQEIYDIRDSRSQLSRGQAEFMPKDGAQLKIMMDNLDTQERALMQVFEGTTYKDTLEKVFTFVPTQPVNKQLFFRFSRKLGLTDTDDLAGIPYYISIEKENNVTEDVAPAKEKKEKDDLGLYVNIPDKITITLFQQEQPVKTFSTLAGQFGKMEALSADLFGKKQTSHILLNPISGSIEKIESETLK